MIKIVKNGKYSNDCMIRSVVNATGEDYSRVHKIMYSHGWRATISRRTGKWEDHITKTLDGMGYSWKRHTFPAVKGMKRMNGERFTERFTEGRYILQMAGHLSCSVDGVLIDSWDCSQKCVYTCYEIL